MRPKRVIVSEFSMCYSRILWSEDASDIGMHINTKWLFVIFLFVVEGSYPDSYFDAH